ncbi:unnamed protein product [Lactuca virosa]|uniref:Uncharacterized protein n=1 Tax=Lactuca virosa TaxID=75947 RepID=A0AAU9M9Q3_9ASTR|nr:unnamed protein product [Lactuca virosa]
MSTMIPSFTCVTVLKKHKSCSQLEIRAQSLRDEGRSSNIVDSNMKILKDRIEAMRMKERLEMNCRPNGWDYTSSYIRKPKKQQEYLQTVALICGTTSLPVLIGTGLLCIFSVIARVNL